MPKVPPWRTNTLRRSKTTSLTVMSTTARARRIRFPEICKNGTMIWATMKAGAPMMKPLR